MTDDEAEEEEEEDRGNSSSDDAESGIGLDDRDVYPAEAILDQKQDGKKRRLFLVQWQGYDTPTCEPEENVTQDLADAFFLHRRHHRPTVQTQTPPPQQHKDQHVTEPRAPRLHQQRAESELVLCPWRGQAMRSNRLHESRKKRRQVLAARPQDPVCPQRLLHACANRRLVHPGGGGVDGARILGTFGNACDDIFKRASSAPSFSPW